MTEESREAAAFGRLLRFRCKQVSSSYRHGDDGRKTKLVYDVLAVIRVVWRNLREGSFAVANRLLDVASPKGSGRQVN